MELPNGTEFFCGDLSEEEQKLVWATHFPPHADLFKQQKIQNTPWKSKPSWYILCLQDHTVHPDLQRWVSKCMGATVTEVESSHVPMLSKPEVVIEVIREAAKAIQQKTGSNPFKLRSTDRPSPDGLSIAVWMYKIPARCRSGYKPMQQDFDDSVRRDLLSPTWIAYC